MGERLFPVGGELLCFRRRRRSELCSLQSLRLLWATHCVSSRRRIHTRTRTHTPPPRHRHTRARLVTTRLPVLAALQGKQHIAGCAPALPPQPPSTCWKGRAPLVPPPPSVCGDHGVLCCGPRTSATDGCWLALRWATVARASQPRRRRWRPGTPPWAPHSLRPWRAWPSR